MELPTFLEATKWKQLGSENRSGLGPRSQFWPFFRAKKSKSSLFPEEKFVLKRPTENLLVGPIVRIFLSNVALFSRRCAFLE